MQCALNLPHTASTASSVSWHHFNSAGQRNEVDFRARRDKYVMTQDFGLVILGVDERDSGSYQCHLGHETVSDFHLSVDAHRCAAPNKTADYQKVYSEWCNEFQKYKRDLKLWEKRQNEQKDKCENNPEKLLAAQNSVYRTDNPYV